MKSVIVSYVSNGREQKVQVRGFTSQSGFLAVTHQLPQFGSIPTPIIGKYAVTHIPTGKYIVQLNDFKQAIYVMRKIDGPEWEGQDCISRYPGLLDRVRDAMGEP